MFSGVSLLILASGTSAQSSMPSAQNIASGWAAFMNEPCVKLIDACVSDENPDPGYYGNPSDVKAVNCYRRSKIAICTFEYGSSESAFERDKCKATFSWAGKPFGWQLARKPRSSEMAWPDYDMTCKFAN